MAKSSVEPKENNPVKTAVNVDVLAGHYQKTFEVAYDYWKERNKLFVTLVLTAILGLLIIQRGSLVNVLLVKYVVKYFALSEQTDQKLIAEIGTTIPFSLVLSGILIAMFYFMQRLYSTNLSVMRTFMYLGALETEVRKHLGLPAESISFTREGSFYWGRRSRIQAMSKYYYVVVLFIILVPFIGFKLIADLESPNLLVIAVDVVVSIMAILYWWAYARSSFRLDVPKMPAEQIKK